MLIIYMLLGAIALSIITISITKKLFSREDAVELYKEELQKEFPDKKITDEFVDLAIIIAIRKINSFVLIAYCVIWVIIGLARG